MALRIGISGWRYKPWRGVFYPPGLVQRRELEYASRALHTIEINGSFYSLQSPKSWKEWHDATPEDFVFAVKGPRYVTHLLRLREAALPLANFFASGLLQLGSKLGPVLWQLPPSLKYEPAALEEFLKQLPHDTDAALALAKRHDPDRMRGRTALVEGATRQVRHALEVRSETFADQRFIRQLRRHGVALVIADTAGKFLYGEDITADFTYLRLHGDEELYTSGYSDQALDHWRQRIQRWAAGGEPRDARKLGTLAPQRRAQRDVYCYFDNDAKVHAPFDAMRLARMLGASDQA